VPQISDEIRSPLIYRSKATGLDAYISGAKRNRSLSATPRTVFLRDRNLYGKGKCEVGTIIEAGCPDVFNTPVSSMTEAGEYSRGRLETVQKPNYNALSC
jgi:hypothetical protein